MGVAKSGPGSSNGTTIHLSKLRPVCIDRAQMEPWEHSDSARTETLLVFSLAYPVTIHSQSCLENSPRASPDGRAVSKQEPANERRRVPVPGIGVLIHMRAAVS